MGQIVREKGPTCRSCGSKLTQTLVDLGTSPLANSYIKKSEAEKADRQYALHARVCNNCWLVQVDDVVPASEIFSDYAYFSSFSESWLEHAKALAEGTIERFSLSDKDHVVEIASNDGYLLQFYQANGIRVLGIEPAKNIAEAARKNGIETLPEFFNKALAERLVSEGCSPTLVASLNVLAHVPDINGFVEGIAILLPEDGVYLVEFPHLLNLILSNQFDTIYHEHYSYLSLKFVCDLFRQFGLRVFDVEEVTTHGGSLRVFASQEHSRFDTSDRVEGILSKERSARLDQPSGYEGFEGHVMQVRRELLKFLGDAKKDGLTVAGYGAAAKGNTLLNYCGIDSQLIPYVVDRNPAKQETLLPGSRIPVHSVETLEKEPPDFVLILPWNIKDEVINQLAKLKDEGTKFVTAIPKLTILS